MWLGREFIKEKKKVNTHASRQKRTRSRKHALVHANTHSYKKASTQKRTRTRKHARKHALVHDFLVFVRVFLRVFFFSFINSQPCFDTFNMIIFLETSARIGACKIMFVTFSTDRPTYQPTTDRLDPMEGSLPIKGKRYGKRKDRLHIYKVFFYDSWLRIVSTHINSSTLKTCKQKGQNIFHTREK